MTRIHTDARHRRRLAVALVAAAVLLAAAGTAGPAGAADKEKIPDFGLKTQGVTKKSVKIGVTYNVSECGQQSDLLDLLPEAGGDFGKAYETFVDYVNDTGGIDGRDLKLVVADDGQGGCDEKAKSAAVKLVDDEKVFLVVPGLHAVSDYAIKKKIPTMVGRDDPKSLKRIGANGIGLEPPIGTTLEAWASFGRYYLDTKKHKPCLVHPDDADWNSYEKLLDKAFDKYHLKWKDTFRFQDEFENAEQQATTGVLRMKDAGCDEVWFMANNGVPLLPFTTAATENDFFPKVWTFTSYTLLTDSDLVALLDQEQWKNAVGLTIRVPEGEHPNEGNCKKIYEKANPGDGFGGSAATQITCAQILTAAEMMRRAIEETGKLTADSLLVGADAITDDFYFDANGPLDWKFPDEDGPFRTKGAQWWTVVKWNSDEGRYDYPEYPKYWKKFGKNESGGKDISKLFGKGETGSSSSTSGDPPTTTTTAPAPGG